MKLKRLQNILINGEYVFIYKYFKGMEELAIDDGSNNVILHYNVDTNMLIALTCIDNVVATKNFYKFSDNIYKQIREFFANKEKIKNFKKVVDKL